MAEVNPNQESIAVLFSGGVDSTVMLARLLDRGRVVQPIYIRQGLIWEPAELAAARQVLRQLRPREARCLARLKVLDLPVGDLYGDHWSITGRGVPDDTSEDAAVYLPGRNPLLLLKACLWCITRGIPQIALGTLARNPFPDARQTFFDTFQRMLFEATGENIEIVRPFGDLSKQELIQFGRHLPLKQTFSCLAPVAGAHCGRCNKCAERKQALTEVHLTRAAS